MTMQDKAYTVVVGIDFSEASDEALDEAFTLSTARNAELHVLYVDDHFLVPEGGREAAEATLSRIEHHALARLEDLGRRLGKQVRFQKLYSHFRLGAAAEQIVQLASDLDADLVVVGTHGRSGIKRLVLGSVAERVIATRSGDLDGLRIATTSGDLDARFARVGHALREALFTMGGFGR
jgi:nucleotide-binding universal stress UspA family protein